MRGDLAWLRARSAEGPLVPEDWLGGGQLLSLAAEHDQAEVLSFLLDLGFDPNERIRLGELDDPIYTWGGPLHRCAGSGKLELAKVLLAHGADPNGQVYASGSAIFKAYAATDRDMVKLLEAHGGFLDAASAGYLGQTDLARRMFAEEAAGRLAEGTVPSGSTVAETLLWSGTGGGDPEIVRMALERIDWAPDDPRWHWPLWQALTSEGREPDRGLACFRLLLGRANPNVSTFGRTILHDVVASGRNVTERPAFAQMLLDSGARTDQRDDLLRSTPLGWACRWGHVEMVELLLVRGADPREADAEPWATPQAWAKKMRHPAVLTLLRRTF
jgi:ankyrin repeat protein